MLSRYQLVAIVLLVLSLCFSFTQMEMKYATSNGNVSFVSEAYLETIKAASQELRGILNLKNNEFAFVVRISSFDGFNSALQKEHFNENYIESKTYPSATFKGKVLDEVIFNTDTLYVRAKGILWLHGKEQEKLIKVRLIKKGEHIYAHSNFSIFLSDYNISIPRIVHEKISTVIKINVNADLVKKLE